MKKELLAYLAGLCQASAAALMASAVIIDDARVESLCGSVVAMAIGLALVWIKEK